MEDLIKHMRAIPRTPSSKPLDCGRRITDSLIGRDVTTLNHEQNLPRGHKLIVGDQTTITL